MRFFHFSETILSWPHIVFMSLTYDVFDLFKFRRFKFKAGIDLNICVQNNGMHIVYRNRELHLLE